MKIGIIGGFFPIPTAETLAAIARDVESLGFESMWTGEHVGWFDAPRLPYPYAADGRLPAGQEGMMEPLTALAFVAGCTSRLVLATGVIILPQRNPLYTAQQIATLDVVAHGRLIVGIGVGWQVEEFEALHVPWSDRGARADEYVHLLRRLWADETVSFDGRFYTHGPLRLYPKPIQRPHPPIHVGGNSEAALSRAARIGQGWYAVGLSPAVVRTRLSTLDELLSEQGRDRGEIQVTVGYRGAIDELSRAIPEYASAGVERLLCNVDRTDVKAARKSLEALAAVVAKSGRVSG